MITNCNKQHSENDSAAAQKHRAGWVKAVMLPRSLTMTLRWQGASADTMHVMQIDVRHMIFRGLRVRIAAASGVAGNVTVSQLHACLHSVHAARTQR